MSSAQRLLAALRSSLQFERSSLHAAAHTNNGDAAPSTALSTFGATGESTTIVKWLIFRHFA